MHARIHQARTFEHSRTFEPRRPHGGSAGRRVSRVGERQLDELRRGIAAIFDPFRPIGGSPA